ncbi:MraY family glycosyltransferase [Paraburkholderia acidipaludis]|uniref:MraY family glycosyltransferase n=1 Tax=Paraburkholderia acidipaludis TaxID=660537 RepID=UPI0005B988CA|nr:glycosyltransferase family 4 protein [Paraburkholderia acidipaludis]
MHYALSHFGPVARLLLCAVFSLCISAAILLILLRTGMAWRLATDIPNDRSLHTRPTPRVGGWGVIPISAILIWCLAPALWLPALAAVLLAILSLIDDRGGLPARVRFGCHVLAAAAFLVVYPGGMNWWALALVAFLLVWLVNLYNFMDGADGLAGGMALFGFAGYTIAALTSAQPNLSLACACAAVAGAAGGFLLFNIYPAKVFLGDAGSIPLGFLAGALGYWGWINGNWPIWFPAIVFSSFIADASVTLLKRVVRGEKFWQAHREHYYQRMVRLGMGHGRTALTWYLIMNLGIILAVWLLRHSAIFQWAAVGVWAVVLVVIGVAIDVCWRRFQSSLSRQKEVDADASQ